ncbi:hypothetical protein LOD99_14140 [Oopsacas minuta]|uniref:Ribosomal protein S18 n=1 Tax=Oopsacas minuta TaxID=111878 RepID=A0AAV7KHH3_9METZ|nr:hypothetical protein LOD99_14140 [Oopsacas minuta]
MIKTVYPLVRSSISHTHHLTIPIRYRVIRAGLTPTVDERIVPIRKILECPLNCICSKEIVIDYKNVELLSQFISPVTGRILSRFSTGICLGRQNEIAKAIIRSRVAGLMPYSIKFPAYISPDLLPTTNQIITTLETNNKDEQIIN